MSYSIGTFAVGFLTAAAVGLVLSRIVEGVSAKQALLIAVFATIGMKIGSMLG